MTIIDKRSVQVDLDPLGICGLNCKGIPPWNVLKHKKQLPSSLEQDSTISCAGLVNQLFELQLQTVWNMTGWRSGLPKHKKEINISLFKSQNAVKLNSFTILLLPPWEICLEPRWHNNGKESSCNPALTLRQFPCQTFWHFLCAQCKKTFSSFCRLKNYERHAATMSKNLYNQY